MNSEQTSLIQFVQACPPALDSGDYRIQIEHQIQSPAQDTFHKEAYFSVQGRRFRLEEADLYAVYPPANQEGHFGNCLPHVVFTRRTLPWERSPDGKTVVRKDDPQEMRKLSPWLALILLRESDFTGDWTGESRPALVGDLLNPPAGIFHPALQLETGQTADEPCKLLDLPVHLFQTILPGRHDLAYLCHVRAVNASAPDAAEAGWFSTVVSNRFPQVDSNGAKNRVHLVSLEGFQDYLPGGGKTLPAGISAVRMVSLTDWSFCGKEEPYSFGELAQKLSAGCLRLPLSGTPQNQAEQMVETMLAQGYTAHPHLFRHGERTVSWHRGPLVPLPVAKAEIDCIPCADHALRYDPGMGLFDVSYASAWQLGRLLSLQNQHFASAMHRFRGENRQQNRAMQNRVRIAQKLEDCVPRQGLDGNLTAASAAAMEDDFYKLFLRYLSSEFMDQLLGENRKEEGILGRPADPTGLRVHADKYHGLLTETRLKSMNAQDGDMAEQLLRHLLHGEED